MFSGQGLGIFGETAEITSSGVAEDYPKTSVLANKVIRGQSQKRMVRWPKTNNGDEELYWKSTAFYVVLHEACVGFSVTRRKVQGFVFGRLGVTTAHAS